VQLHKRPQHLIGNERPHTGRSTVRYEGDLPPGGMLHAQAANPCVQIAPKYSSFYTLLLAAACKLMQSTAQHGQWFQLLVPYCVHVYWPRPLSSSAIFKHKSCLQQANELLPTPPGNAAGVLPAHETWEQLLELVLLLGVCGCAQHSAAALGCAWKHRLCLLSRPC
jgi:hypothetical protein